MTMSDTTTDGYYILTETGDATELNEADLTPDFLKKARALLMLVMSSASPHCGMADLPGMSHKETWDIYEGSCNDIDTYLSDCLDDNKAWGPTITAMMMVGYVDAMLEKLE